MVICGRTIMQALELLRLEKGMARDEATLNSEEIKSITSVVIKLHLPDGVNNWVWVSAANQSVVNSTK